MVQLFQEQFVAPLDDMLQPHLYTELYVHNVRRDVLQAAAVRVDQHSEGELQLTALLQHL